MAFRPYTRRFPADLAWASIDELAAEHKITVRPVSSRYRSESHIATRQVWVPPQRGPVDYLVALHEIGHIASPEARRQFRHYAELLTLDHELCLEAAAWGWALQAADRRLLNWMSRKHWTQIHALLGTYLVPPPRPRQ